MKVIVDDIKLNLNSVKLIILALFIYLHEYLVLLFNNQVITVGYFDKNYFDVKFNLLVYRIEEIQFDEKSGDASACF